VLNNLNSIFRFSIFVLSAYLLDLAYLNILFQDNSYNRLVAFYMLAYVVVLFFIKIEAASNE